VLKKWIPVEKQQKVLGNEVWENNSKAGALPEIPGVDVTSEVARMGSSPSLYLDLLKTFRRDSNESMPLLEKVPESIELQPFVTRVHALRSALGNIGANNLSQT